LCVESPLLDIHTRRKSGSINSYCCVLEHINNQLAEDILEALTDESDLSLVSFDNQVTGVDSVLDAAIKSSTALWSETKTSRDAVDQTHLENHLHALEEDKAELQRLIALTPDARLPDKIVAVNDERIVWVNFDSLVDTIETVLERDTGSTGASMSSCWALSLAECSPFLRGSLDCCHRVSVFWSLRLGVNSSCGVFP
jgi:hypothetical protein